MKLGAIPTHPARVAEAPTHRFGAFSPPPPVLDRSGFDILPELYENDVLNNCTAVSYFNGARCVAKLAGYDLTVAESAPRRFFSRCVGDPPDLHCVDGCVPLDVLENQAARVVDIGPQFLTGRFGTVGLSRSALAHSLATFGFGYWAVMLRDRDMENISAGLVWDVVDGRDDGPAVGGHMLIGWDYDGLSDQSIVRLGTWGVWQPATWAWVRARLVEAYGLVWRSLARPDGTFYGGLSADGLVGEL